MIEPKTKIQDRYLYFSNSFPCSFETKALTYLSGPRTTTTLLFHHLARLFTSYIQLGYIPTAWKVTTLSMLLKPDKLLSLTTSYRSISLISSIMKLFERIIEQRLRSHLEQIEFVNKHQSGVRRVKLTNDHLFRLSQSIINPKAGFHRVLS